VTYQGENVNPDLTTLLALQEEDTVVLGLEARLRELDARVAALDHDRGVLREAIERVHQEVDVGEHKRRELAHKVEEHKALQDRNLAALDAVRKAREATAAMAQIDLTRRVLAQEEAELQALTGRLGDMRQAAELHSLELEELEERQDEERGALDRQRAELEEELAQARARRESSASRVSRQMLAMYERIRGREKSHALYPLRGAACGRCNTAIPLQRRNVIAAGRSIEVCEGCGVLLYAAS
jgi:predicted  nucleic acid-binding Zn-ribbon protein